MFLDRKITYGLLVFLIITSSWILYSIKTSIEASLFSCFLCFTYSCRFLRARKFDIDKTLHMWEEMLKWREEYGVDSIIKVKM